jgi:beta-lactamase class A
VSWALPAFLVVLVVSTLLLVLFNTGGSGREGLIAAPPISTLASSETSPVARVEITPVDVAQLQNPPVQVTPLVTAIPTPTATPHPLSSIPESPEQEAARTLLNGQSGVYGFVVLAEDGSVISAYNSTTPFVTASTYKLILMADIYRRIEAGELELDEWLYLDPSLFDASGGDMYYTWEESGTWKPVSDLLYAIGAWSSNVAALTLLPYTTPKDLRATAASIGMTRTYLFVDPRDVPFWPPQPGIDSSPEDIALAREYIEGSAAEGPVNITTPYDMAVYNLGLLHGTVISPWVSEQILDILRSQAIRDRLPVYLWDIPVANKPGNLEGVVNDVGLLFLPEGTRAVAALSENVPDDIHATSVLQLLGLIASGSTDIW